MTQPTGTKVSTVKPCSVDGDIMTDRKILSVGICWRAIRSSPVFRRNILSLSSGYNLCVKVQKMTFFVMPRGPPISHTVMSRPTKWTRLRWIFGTVNTKKSLNVCTSSCSAGSIFSTCFPVIHAEGCMAFFVLPGKWWYLSLER